MKRLSGIFKNRVLLVLSALGFLSASSGLVAAKNRADPETVVVTGSRIPQQGLTSTKKKAVRSPNVLELFSPTISGKSTGKGRQQPH